MFSQVSVCHSVRGGGGYHMTITHDPLDLTAQGPQLQPPPPDMKHEDPLLRTWDIGTPPPSRY